MRPAARSVWNVEVFRQSRPHAPKIHNKNSHASPTPLVEGEPLYVHFGHQGTACLDLAGKVLWKNDRIKYAPVHGNGGSPVLVDGLLIFSCDGADDPFVVALDAATGEEAWRFERPERSAEEVLVLHADGRSTSNGQKQLITPGSGVVNALDPATGREIWRVHARRLLGDSQAGLRPRPGVPQHRLRLADRHGHSPGRPAAT